MRGSNCSGRNEESFVYRQIAAMLLGAALMALTAFQVGAQDAEPASSGTITIHGVLCATPDDDPAACPAAESPGDIGIYTPDGGHLSLADATAYGVDYVWGEGGGLAFGTYYLDTGGLVYRPGYSLVGYPGTYW